MNTPQKDSDQLFDLFEVMTSAFDPNSPWRKRTNDKHYTVPHEDGKENPLIEDVEWEEVKPQKKEQ